MNFKSSRYDQTSQSDILEIKEINFFLNLFVITFNVLLNKRLVNKSRKFNNAFKLLANDFVVNNESMSNVFKLLASNSTSESTFSREHLDSLDVEFNI